MQTSNAEGGRGWAGGCAQGAASESEPDEAEDEVSQMAWATSGSHTTLSMSRVQVATGATNSSCGQAGRGGRQGGRVGQGRKGSKRGP